MAHLSKEGKFIITAGEVAAYTVCPEAWRLRSVAKLQPEREESSIRGKQLHREWVAKYDESIYLARHARLVVLLFLIAVGAFLIMV